MASGISGDGAGGSVNQGVNELRPRGPSSTSTSNVGIPGIITNSSSQQWRALTADQVAILEEYWGQGLTSYRSPENKARIVEIAKRTGLSAKRIKNWINNKKVSEHRRKFGNHKKTPAVKPRKKSAYHCFMADFLSTQASGSSTASQMTAANKMWQSLKGTEQVQKYTTMANQINDEGKPKVEPPQRRIFIRKVVNEIHQLCSKLEEHGCEALCAAVDHEGNLITTGTNKGDAFLMKEDEFLRRFGLYMSGGHSLPERTTPSPSQLRTQVQEIFNDKYRQATGKTQFSYKQLAAGAVIVDGMPSGVTFKRPSALGVKDLKAIIAGKEMIRVYIGAHIDETLNTQVDQPDQDMRPESPETQVEQPDQDPVEILNNMFSDPTSLEEEKEDNQTEYYPIEKIIKQKIVNGKVQYRVKWKGCPSKFNQWVDDTDVTKEAVDAFLSRSKKTTRT